MATVNAQLSRQLRDNIMFYGRWLDAEVIHDLDNSQSGLAGMAEQQPVGSEV